MDNMQPQNPMMPPPMPGQGVPPGGGMGSPDPQAILQQMLGQNFPPMPGKMKKPTQPKGLKTVVKNENKNTTPATPEGKLQKARDMIQAVIKELGPQSEMSSALSGLVRNLEMQLNKLKGSPMSEEAITGQGDMGEPTIGVGTPLQLPPEGGSGILSPQSISTNISGNF